MADGGHWLVGGQLVGGNGQGGGVSAAQGHTGVRPHPTLPLLVPTIPPHLSHRERWWERVEEGRVVCLGMFVQTLFKLSHAASVLT